VRALFFEDVSDLGSHEIGLDATLLTFVRLAPIYPVI
jgi:hypothetical protein